MDTSTSNSVKRPGVGEIVIIVIICAALSYVAMFTHLIMVDLNAENDIQNYHTAVLEGDADSPMQYRPGAYLIAHGLEALVDGNTVQAYVYERLIFTFTLGFLTFLLLRTVVRTGWAMVGTLWLYAILPLTYIGYGHQPADPINATMFVAAYLAVFSGMSLWTLFLTPLAVVFRETAILIPAFMFIAEIGRKKFGGLIAKTIGAITTGGVVIVAIYLFYGERDHPDDWVMLTSNLDNLHWVGNLVLLAGIPLLLGLVGWKGTSALTRRGILFGIIYLIIHLVFGRFGETRLYLPVLPLFIAFAIEGLRGRFSDDRK